MPDDRLDAQLRFIAEIDDLKSVLRRTWLINGTRLENSAEHSWHVATMAVLLAEYAPADVDIGRVIRMLLVHDVVEIDAGDTFAYDAEGNQNKAMREQAAADRLFGMLPAEQGEALRGLWDEFEDGTSADARYAVALDRLQPLLQNVRSQGGAWRRHGVTRRQVLERMRPIEAVSADLWAFVERVVDEVSAAGWLADDRADR